MGDVHQSIRDALASEGPIRRQIVRRWIQKAATVETDALLYELTDKAWNRIEPKLERRETCALIERYLLGCIREDPRGGQALGRYDAAGELELWFDHLAGMDDTQEILQTAVSAITTVFLTSDDDVRRAIEHGFLEHVL